MKNNKKRSIMFSDGLFTPFVVGFIQYKRSCGLKYDDSAEYVLRAICVKLNQYHLERPKLTKAMVEDVIEKRPGEQYSTQSRRINYMRQLAIYLSRQGIAAYIYPELCIHKEDHSFVPYLFSDDEIRDIFAAADRLRPIIRYPQYQAVYPVLVRLLYSSGLRISEALNLRLKHFDKSSNALLIEHSKNDKSRVVPLSASMSCVMAKYINKRFELYPNLERYIFEAPDGDRYNRGAVRSTILNIFRAANVPTATSGHHARVHDLRHLFSIKAMEKMKSEGMDLYCAMPLLSKYLGHVGLRETEKYLWLPDFRMDDLSAPSRQIETNMIPEVSWDED